MKKDNDLKLTYFQEFILFISSLAFTSIFFWKQISTGFCFVFGKGYDVLIERFLVSHWTNVFNGITIWNNPLYLYPHTNTLGFNDSYFLYGVIAWLFDLHSISGGDLIHAIMKVIGFWAMCRLMLKITKDFQISLLTAALFTLVINSSNQAGHGQLFLSSLSPLLSLLLLNLIYGITYKRSWTYKIINGVSFSIFLAAVFFTGFYISWFFCLFLLLFFMSFFLFKRSQSINFIKIASSQKLLFFVLFITFIISIFPFLMVYLPNLKQTGGQSFPTQLGYSLHAIDIFNIGEGSLLWGAIYTHINSYLGGIWRSGEFEVGFTPDVLLMFFISVVYFFYKKTTLHQSLLLPLA
ncbi:hypothetical protein [Pantoea sp. CTOTU49201]|uniref:hypothetical protein n=1 Tax=Pantoea sp. CTOTU49201 TaxID=2953855 RepID=UPI00289D6768|nr:hypothetical protein [Pantoea sp. CTOTU49201]